MLLHTQILFILVFLDLQAPKDKEGHASFCLLLLFKKS